MNKKLLFYIFLLNLVKLNNNPGLYKKFMNVNVSLIGLILLIGSMMFAACFSRVQGIGMMEEEPNQTTTTQEETFKQNQVKCLNLDDGWWSPIAGPITVNACGPSANTGEGSNLEALSKQTEISTTPSPTTESNAESTPTTESPTTSTPPTETETSTPSTDVTETKDKEGNTVLSSTIQNLTITAIAVTQSIKEVVGTPEVAQQVAKQVANESKKDYNRGLVEGIKYAFKIGEGIGTKSDEIMKEQSKMTPEQLNESRSSAALSFTLQVTQNKSNAYKLGLSRGLTLGADFVDTTGISGLPHKQQVK